MEHELQDVVRAVINHRWNKEFQQALDLFKTKLAPLGRKQIMEHPRLISAICDCLRETGKTREAVHFVLNWLGMDAEMVVQNELGVNMAWLLFFYFQQPDQQVADSELEFAEMLIVKLGAGASRSIAERLFFAWTEKQKGRGEAGYSKLLEVLQMLGPETFDTQTRQISIRLKGKEKEVELASAREQAMMLLIKALYALRQYGECIEVCNKTLQSGIEFHYGNQIWIARYMALSYRQTGKLDEAIHHLELVLRKRREWFVMKELAELYEQVRQIPKAIALATSAAGLGGYSAYKTGLFELLGRMLKDSDGEKSVQWYALAARSRIEAGWRLSYELQAVPLPENTTAAQMYQALMEHAGLLKQTAAEEEWVGTGRLTRILHAGENGDGFITSDDGRTVYFRFAQSKVPADQLIEGARYSFKAVKEMRKGKETWRAKKVFACKE
ncbi:MAG: hypothetical protein IPM52_03390 [Bacteroidetes bacterium]|nr:hypothetical protein [Bacteroidota bacterium]